MENGLDEDEICDEDVDISDEESDDEDSYKYEFWFLLSKLEPVLSDFNIFDCFWDFDKRLKSSQSHGISLQET